LALQVTVPALDVQQAKLQTIDIGQVAIGPITVGDLVLNNADVSMSAAQAVLQSVGVTIHIHVTVDWNIHIGLPDGIPDINIGDTYDLGTLSFGPINIGDVVIPGISDIHLHIPSMTAQNMSVSANPLGLTAHNATADQIHATGLALPTAGFSIAGLALSSIQGNTISVPAAKLDQTTIGHLHGDAIQVPAFTGSNLNLPAAQIPQLSSSAPLDVPANLSTLTVGFDAGILVVHINLTPSALMSVNHLEITNANASATVQQIVLHNVTLPYDVLNLTLSQIGINTVAIPALNVS
jgi:hypothetical protein